MDPAPLPGAAIGLLRAANPGPLTLTGTNTSVVGSDPCWVIDPGPDRPAHLGSRAQGGAWRGGAGRSGPPPSPARHAAGVEGRRGRLPVARRAGGGVWRATPGSRLGRELAPGDAFGPLQAIAL